MRVLTYTHIEYHVMFEWYLALKAAIDDKDSKILRDTKTDVTAEGEPAATVSRHSSWRGSS